MINDHPTLLAAYALWGLSWIHPFIEGNGRSVLFADLPEASRLLPGKKIVPERIWENRPPCYDALRPYDRGHGGNWKYAGTFSGARSHFRKRRLTSGRSGVRTTSSERQTGIEASLFVSTTVAAGRSIVKTEPVPAVLSAVTSPPMARARSRLMARPRPTPRAVVD